MLKKNRLLQDEEDNEAISVKIMMETNEFEKFEKNLKTLTKKARLNFLCM